MAQTVTARVPFPSARALERSLGALFVALLATYALGEVVNGALPVVRTAGVVAVHVAAVVGVAFLTAVLGRAAVARVQTGESRERRLETGVAAVATGCLVIALLVPTDPATTALLGIGVGASLLLAFLVLVR